jgi:hypothetical protein
MASITQSIDDGNQEFPAAWLFSEDGDLEAAEFVALKSGPTRSFGWKPIAVVRVGGQERSLWLLNTVLYESFKRELARRPSRKLEAGERITVRKKGQTRNAEGTRTYEDYKVVFHDTPQPSVTEMFGLDEPEPAAGDASGDESNAVDSDTPF